MICILVVSIIIASCGLQQLPLHHHHWDGSIQSGILLSLPSASAFSPAATTTTTSSVKNKLLLRPQQQQQRRRNLFYNHDSDHDHNHIHLVLLLQMGGYYNEPDDLPVDQSETHMIFGIRCVETKTTIPTAEEAAVVVGLQPITDDSSNSPEMEYGPAILQYIMDNGPATDSIRRVVEIGASSAGLALARIIGKGGAVDNKESSSAIVTYCHPDSKRLLILEHAHQFLNTAPSCLLGTKQITPKDPLLLPLPSSSSSSAAIDIIIFTLAMGDDVEGNEVLKTLLEEAMKIQQQKPPRIIIPSDLISDSLLQSYQFLKSDDGSIIEILLP